MKTANPRFLFGTDPEFFIADAADQIIPAEAIVKGKEAGESIYCDNAAIELTVPPGNSPKALVQNVHSVLKNGVNPLLSKHELKPFWRSAVSIDQKWFTNCKYLCEFGCEPSLVLNEDYQPVRSVPFVNPFTTQQRSAGCHLHLGMDPAFAQITEPLLYSREGHIPLAQNCDLLLGIPSVILRYGEDDRIRRTIVGYGRASEFRPQPWGFEYRSLPSWVLGNPKWLYVFVSLLHDAGLLTLVLNSFPTELDYAEVSKTVNEGNKKSAIKIWQTVTTLTDMWKKRNKQFVAPSYSIVFGAAKRLKQFNMILFANNLQWKLLPTFAKWPKTGAF